LGRFLPLNAEQPEMKAAISIRTEHAATNFILPCITTTLLPVEPVRWVDKES
jgi:hypothetical protein